MERNDYEIFPDVNKDQINSYAKRIKDYEDAHRPLILIPFINASQFNDARWIKINVRRSSASEKWIFFLSFRFVIVCDTLSRNMEADSRATRITAPSKIDIYETGSFSAFSAVSGRRNCCVLKCQ
jgi:hypothetical protein